MKHNVLLGNLYIQLNLPIKATLGTEQQWPLCTGQVVFLYKSFIVAVNESGPSRVAFIDRILLYTGGLYTRFHCNKEIILL